MQTIASREMATTEAAVLAAGVLQAGTKDNVIPDEALIKLNERMFDEEERARVIEDLRKIRELKAAKKGS